MPPEKSLSRSLSLFPATAIVIGSVVGSGIFVSSSGMARALGSAHLLLLVWVIAGVLTLLGALTQCELIGLMPRTGGLYEYLKEIYGEPIGFLYGWANFMIAGSGAIAAIAFICASFVSEWVVLPHLSEHFEKWPVTIPWVGTLFPLADLGTKILGSAVIAFLTVLNIRGIKLGAWVQSISTSSKVIAILLVVAVAFAAGGSVGSYSNFHSVTSQGAALSGWALIGAVGLAMSGAFWSYDGWGNIAYIAGEVREPEKTIPRAILLGTFLFISLYLLINLAYLYILPIEVMGQSPQDRVASSMMSAVLGPRGAMLVAALIILSTFDTTNSTVLTNARVYYAMARDRVFWRPAEKIHPRFQTPYLALACQGVWSVILLISGSFDLITSMYVFVNWLLYVLMAVGIFVMRRRHPKGDRARPFVVPGYPYLPGAFVLFSSIYVLVTLVADIQLYLAGGQPMIKSLMGLLLVATGLPFYLYWKKSRRLESHS